MYTDRYFPHDTFPPASTICFFPITFVFKSVCRQDMLNGIVGVDQKMGHSKKQIYEAINRL